MSDTHDHSQPGHDHGHGHGHEPESGPESGSGQNAVPPPPGDLPEDAGTQALADALRSSFAIIKVLMIGLVVLFLFSGFFTVAQQEKAIILRFGRPLGGGDGQLLGPGPHWAFPPPIDEVIKIPVGQVQSVNSTIGWYATSPAAEAAGMEMPAGPSLNPLQDGYLLTADVNIIHVRATLRYRIAEPGLRYQMELADGSNVVRNAFDNALLYAAARYRVDDALTRDVAGFREAARVRLEQLIERQNLGIIVDQIDGVRVIPPRQVKESFARVIEAEVIRGKELNEARGYANQTLSTARAAAQARKNSGQTERTRLVEFVAAEVERFTNNLPAWRANADLFFQQRQSETLRAIFTNAQEKTVVPDRGPGAGRSIWLQLDRELPKPKAPEPPKRDSH